MNSQIGKNTVGGELLRSYIDRLENLAQRKREVSLDENAVMAEAKSKGLVPAAIRYCLKVRKMKPSDRQEADTLRDMYLHSLGMLPDLPLFKAVEAMAIDTNSKEHVIEAMRKFVPMGGSIIVDAGGGNPVRMTRDKDGTVRVEEVYPPKAKGSATEWPTPPSGKARPEVPECTADQAERLGADAFHGDVPIIENPFPFGDDRRARWDKGWRDASGGDGMDD